MSGKLSATNENPWTCAHKPLMRLARSEGAHPFDNHVWLRLRVEANPGLVHRSYANGRAEPEVDLDSADRADVVCYGDDKTVVVEAKSRDSNIDDLRRGVYPCVQYRAVQTAMDARRA